MQIINVVIVKETSRELAIELAIKEMYREEYAQEYIDEGRYHDGVLTHVKVTSWESDLTRPTTTTSYFLASKINDVFIRVEKCM